MKALTERMCLRISVCTRVDAARFFNCEHSEVSVGEHNGRLKCEVRAQPRLTALFWIIDDNGTTVYEGKVVDRYWTLILVRYLLTHFPYYAFSIGSKDQNH